MARRTLLTVLLSLVLALPVLALVPAPPAAAQSGWLGLAVDCIANPERTTITNGTGRPLALWTLGLTSLY